MKLPSTIALSGWAGEIKVNHHGARVTDRQHAALAATKKRAKSMKPKLLDAIVAAYPTLREWPAKARPKTMSVARLEKLIELWKVLFTKDHHDDVGYVAYGFECTWDPSGITVLTHGDRVVSVGSFEVLEYPHKDPVRGVRAPKGPTPAQRKAAIASAKKRALKNPKTLPAESDGDELWITLPAWAGFSSRAGGKPSNGQVGVSIADAEQVTAEHQAAYRHVLKTSAKTQRLLLDAIAAELPKLPRDPEVPLPAKVDRAALITLVELTSVVLHEAHADGLAYVGYELSCAWDREHGVGVMTHADRIVEVGQADTAILGWIASRDRKKRRTRD